MRCNSVLADTLFFSSIGIILQRHWRKITLFDFCCQSISTWLEFFLLILLLFFFLLDFISLLLITPTTPYWQCAAPRLASLALIATAVEYFQNYLRKFSNWRQEAKYARHQRVVCWWWQEERRRRIMVPTFWNTNWVLKCCIQSSYMWLFCKKIYIYIYNFYNVLNRNLI